MLVPHSDFATEGPQPMEVAPQTEAASTVENQPVEDPPSSRFTWTIENFSRLNTKKHYSDVFFVGGYKWRVLIFPKGNNVTTCPYTQHQFNARESDWGFTSFMPLSKLYDPSRGYLVNDTCVVEAEGTVVEGTIQQLFEGHHMNYIERIIVGYKSTRKESFYDLQLDVKGCRDVYASFDKYVEAEHLEGDNKYHAEQHGLQINDCYEFPLQLDLDREMESIFLWMQIGEFAIFILYTD
ncbi:hypothetical protein AAC387_Pa07g2067 [Persea americana]